MKRHRTSGFTLQELMMVVTIIAILATIAVPSFQALLERNRLKQVVEGLKSDLQFARTEAIKRSVNIKVSRKPGNDGTWCYGLTEDAVACDCTQPATAANCNLKIVSGAAYSATNMRADGDDSDTFDFRRGNIIAPIDRFDPNREYDSELFSTDHYEAQVRFFEIGRVIVCTPVPADLLSLIHI